MSALSTLEGAWSARQSSDTGGRRATSLPPMQPPFRGAHRGRRLLLPGQREPRMPAALETRVTAKGGGDPAVGERCACRRQYDR
jgi:hypothetical protein